MSMVQGSQSAPTRTSTPAVFITHALRPVPGSAYCYFLHLKASQSVPLKIFVLCYMQVVKVWMSGKRLKVCSSGKDVAGLA